MLAPSKNVRLGRRTLVWLIALTFAFAPAVSIALATPSGLYSRVLVHIHANDAPGHVHFDQDHDHGDDVVSHASDEERNAGHDNGDAADHSRLHVHYDVGTPSILLPALTAHKLGSPMTARIAPMPDRELRPVLLDRLLRPPIAPTQL